MFSVEAARRGEDDCGWTGDITAGGGSSFSGLEKSSASNRVKPVQITTRRAKSAMRRIFIGRRGCPPSFSTVSGIFIPIHYYFTAAGMAFM
jgi:hypothetical protein